MAKNIKDIKNKFYSINQEASELGLHIRVAGAPARVAGADVPAYLETDSFSMDPIFVGRENEVRKMVEMLTSLTEDVISVFSIFGMGGLGKTTLARKVFNDGEIVSHFGERERIWVHVPENFDPVIVLKKTLESLTGENADGSREVVLRKLAERLKDKRYLLVLDNVWNEEIEKWENFINSLKGISHAKGNVIMVTTRKSNVASIVKTVDARELGGLSEDDCWSIIKAKAFDGVYIPSEFEAIGKNIAQRCGGLPLAAQVVGSLLRGKSKDEWVSIEKNWFSDIVGDENCISKILKLSFDNLSTPRLKKCFAFLSIIPKGWWIDPNILIDIWMAEGYLQTRQEDMEIVGNKVLKLLIQSSLLQVRERDDYGNILFCDMHDLVYDLAQSVLNSTDEIRYRCIPFIEESSILSTEDAKGLRALFFSDELSHNLISNLKCLHVLILNNENVKELPTEIGRLISLRYINIALTRIECLPDSIGDLYHLQALQATLDGKSYLKKLPDTIKYLTSLRHLGIPNIKLPPGIGKLISLQSLSRFQVGDEKGCGIMELGSLKNLRGEIEIHNLEKVSDKEEAKSADLFHKSNILKLKLVWNESDEGERTSADENVLDGLQPHWNLKRLEINGFQGKSFPLWTLRMEVREDLESRWVRLDNLLEIKLSGCKECEKIPMLGCLPHLKSLYLHQLSNVKSLGYTFYGIEENGIYNEMLIVFPSLEKLELVGMHNLAIWEEVHIPSEVFVFPHLKYLKITNCRQLKSAPSDFPCLKELEINNMESVSALANICGSKLTSLTKLKIDGVEELVSLPIDLFCNNRDLLKLDIRNCNNLKHLIPCLGGGGACLRKLKIEQCRSLEELPEDLHSFSALEKLLINECPNLRSIPYPSGGGSGFTSLRLLKITRCRSVTKLPVQMIESCASSLVWLWLGRSKSITNLPQVINILPKMPRLIGLNIVKVPKFSEVAVKIGCLGSLKELGFGGSSDCSDYVSFKACLDPIFPTLQRLEDLVLRGMEHWDALPDHLQHLTNLELVSFHLFGIEALPEWIGNLSSLNFLGLYKCRKLRRLPSKKVMQGLTKLTEIKIGECPLLKQNLKDKASHDSEWSKISHIETIMVDDILISSSDQ